MRQDFFTFTPQFKLFIAGNHRPGLSGVDEAIRRRMHLVPFNVTIPENDRDLELPEKLKAEWPGILSWMIDGCLMWQADGLDPPESVRAATETTSPPRTPWSAGATTAPARIRTLGKQRRSLALMEALGRERRRIHRDSARLCQTIEGRGFTPERQGKSRTRGYRGHRLNRPDYTDEPRVGG